MYLGYKKATMTVAFIFSAVQAFDYQPIQPLLELRLKPSEEIQAQYVAIDHLRYDIADGPDRRKTDMGSQPGKMVHDHLRSANHVAKHYDQPDLGHCATKIEFWESALQAMPLIQETFLHL